jgi:hypothetical protein
MPRVSHGVSNASIWGDGDYTAVATRIAGIAEQVVRAIDHRRPLKDTSVVDLCCGTGSAALAAARRDALIDAFETALVAHTRPDGRVTFDASYIVVTAQRR